MGVPLLLGGIFAPGRMEVIQQSRQPSQTALNNAMLEPVSKKWSLTQSAFDKFLACLDQDRDGAGLRYELIRSKLINYFDWRDCPSPEDHADETINRVVR